MCNQYVTVETDQPWVQVYFNTKIMEEENFKNYCIINFSTK